MQSKKNGLGLWVEIPGKGEFLNDTGRGVRCVS